MLELRPNCERCDVDLPPAADARICTYECTFCPDCAENHLQNVCPNCGGGFVPRPIRPVAAYREGTGLVNDPPGTRRRSLSYSAEEIADLVSRLRAVDPADR
jgi:hypothetical protein